MRFGADAFEDSRSAALSTSGRTGLSPEAIEKALEAGAEIIRAAAEAKVSAKAKSHPRGQLGPSISFRMTDGPLYAQARLGWKKSPIKLGAKAKSRKVRDVSGYARILEYSPNRQLRHLEEAYAEKESAAYDAIEAALDQAADAMAKECGL